MLESSRIFCEIPKAKGLFSDISDENRNPKTLVMHPKSHKEGDPTETKYKVTDLVIYTGLSIACYRK